jgi:hypothetical protein
MLLFLQVASGKEMENESIVKYQLVTEDDCQGEQMQRVNLNEHLKTNNLLNVIGHECD